MDANSEMLPWSDSEKSLLKQWHDSHRAPRRRAICPSLVNDDTETPTPLAVKTAEMRAERMARRTAKEQEAYRQGYLAGAQASGRSWRKVIGAVGRSLRPGGGRESP